MRSPLAALLAALAMSGPAPASAEDAPAPPEPAPVRELGASRRVYRYVGPLAPPAPPATLDRQAIAAQIRGVDSLAKALGLEESAMLPAVREAFEGMGAWARGEAGLGPLGIAEGSPARAAWMAAESWRLWRVANPGESPPADFLAELSAALTTGQASPALAERRSRLEKRLRERGLARGNAAAWLEEPSLAAGLEAVDPEALRAALSEPLGGEAWEEVAAYAQTYPLQEAGGREGFVLVATNSLDFKAVKPDMAPYVIEAARGAGADRQARASAPSADGAAPSRTILALMRAELAKPDPSEEVLAACLEALRAAATIKPGETSAR